jgi:isocitrate dehydrogenase
MSKVPVTVAYGDGIGPEIMSACVRVLEAAGAQIDFERIEVGEKAYLAGHTSGIPDSAWESIFRTKVLYKAPITTPQGGGYKSLNVTIRKTLGLFANLRPAVSYFPAIDTRHPLMRVFIVRENEEDLYAGIEHRHTAEVYQTLKLITQPGSEKIIRYAFEYARANNRKKITCFTKDNIMKLTDGTFHKVFDEVAKEYPEIRAEHMIIDIGAARLADRPEKFDVIVVPNLYGDIVSDIAAELTGSVGLGISANIGEEHAMFEAIHGSAPDIAGKGIANPSGLLMAGMHMLVHIGQPDIAAKIGNAWRATIEEGIHTADIFKEDSSSVKVGTDEFANAVITRLGRMPEYLRPVRFSSENLMRPVRLKPRPKPAKQLVGIDVFVDWDHSPRDPNILGKRLMDHIQPDGMRLTMITNRGLKVYPNEDPTTFLSDHWRCRFISDNYAPIVHQQIVHLLAQFEKAGLDFVKTEHLYTFDGKPGFSLGQGE